MSGPKGWDVALSAELLRERELAARRRSWVEVVRHVEEVVTAARELGVDLRHDLAVAGFPRAVLERPGDEDLERLDELGEVRTRLRRSLDDSTRRRAAEQAAEVLSDVRRELADLPFTVSLPTTTTTTTARSVEARSQAEMLVDVLGACGLAGDDLTREVRDLAQEQHDLTHPRWLRLRTRLAAAVQQESDRARRDQVRDELLTVVARIDGPVAEGLRARLQAATSSMAVESLRTHVMEQVARVETDDVSGYVLAQAAEVWRGLGYDVDTDLRELAHDGGGPAVLGLPGHPAHGLQVRFDPAHGALATNVVAAGATDAVADREAEEDHCATLPGFVAGLAERGVAADLTRQVDAGRLPVQRRGVERDRRRSAAAAAERGRRR